MKIADLIKNTIDRFAYGYVFTYSDFDIEVQYHPTVVRHLNRMVASNAIARLSKGRYYKVERSQYGDTPPDEYQVVKDLLESDGKLIGYITGNRVFNELGLTTQISNVVHIGSNQRHDPQKRGVFRLKFIMQKNIITKDNVPYLKVLDAIKLIKNIPAATIDESVVVLCGVFKNYSQGDIKTITRLSMKYPPSTRALLGAILENTSDEFDTSDILNSLSGVSVYNIGVSDKVLPNIKNWKIQ
jgi:hypothetical protein